MTRLPPNEPGYSVPKAKPSDLIRPYPWWAAWLGLTLGIPISTALVFLLYAEIDWGAMGLGVVTMSVLLWLIRYLVEG